MKPIFVPTAGAIALTAITAACVPAPDSTPAPETTQVVVAPTPTPSPTPASAVVQSFDSWIDAPQTNGNWTYRTTTSGSLASFGESQQGARFTIECFRGTGKVALARAPAGESSTAMTIRTETSDRTLSISTSGSSAVANLSARDPLLDAIALTRGRFAVETQGATTLYLPNWAEVTRVIEDCR